MDYSLWQPTAVVSEITNQGSSRLFLQTPKFHQFNLFVGLDLP